MKPGLVSRIVRTLTSARATQNVLVPGWIMAVGLVALSTAPRSVAVSVALFLLGVVVIPAIVLIQRTYKVVTMGKTRLAFGWLTLAVLVAGTVGLSAQRDSPRNRPQSAAMSGTYELEAARGDDAERAADLATRNLPQPQRDRSYHSLRDRLQPPTTLAIDRQGRTITINSSSGPRATFDADGVTRREVGWNGSMTSTRAEFIGDRLSVSTSGNRSTDFLVTFESVDGGQGLLVTRRFDGEDLRQPVSVRSYYRRVASEPRWDLYAPDVRRPETGRFALPDGMRLTAVLETSVDTRTSRSGERFWMTVRTPEEYQGARIAGVIARITPYGPGRNADMGVNFDTISLRNGEASDFDAVLTDVRTPSGVTLRVDAGDRSRDTGRDDTVLQQGAVGAALGAIIGAMAGGGKGAALGAVVGGAGGAILAQDRDSYLDLPAGTQVTLVVIGPRYARP